MLLEFCLNYMGMSIAAPPEASCSITHFHYRKDFFYKIQCGAVVVVVEQ